MEVNEPKLGFHSEQTEALFKTGHLVGDIAKYLYGSPSSIDIPYEKGLSHAIEQTAELIETKTTEVIFEATFEYEGILVRVDVLVPVENGYNLIEVKASTSAKPYHELDCAIQYWVLTKCGLNVTSVLLAHINNQFEYLCEGDYDGLLTEVDLTETVVAREQEVIALINEAQNALKSYPDVPVGAYCTSPYECQFFDHCWPMDATYPIIGFRGSKKRLADWVNTGYTDVRDVPASVLTTDSERRIYNITKSEEPEILTLAKKELASLAYPRYYLDFESIGPAVPIWKGCRPYQAFPVQYSCHIEYKQDDFDHVDFLDLKAIPPMRSLADSLISHLGKDGPVFMYSSYEKQMIQVLIKLFPDLTKPLESIIERLVDLLPLVKNNYYHPNMLGSWSIKSVVPTIDPALDYARLEGIKEGMGASEGYLEAIHPDTLPDRKEQLEQQLRRYCRFDTEAMVAITQFFENQPD